jgi:O-methyltransferase involved in polyketide biosynthesis
LKEDAVEDFLSRRGFYQVKSISLELLKKTYFKGVNANRHVTNLGGIVQAIVAHGE